MLDIHILTLGDKDSSILERCVQSVEAAAAAAPYDVAVHVVKGVEGDLGAARKKGYAEGTYTYVTSVDEDDFIAEDTFASIALDGADAYTTGENVYINDKLMESLPKRRHHLAIYKREAIADLPYDTFKYYPDLYLLRVIESTHYEITPYNYCQYTSITNTKRRYDTTEAYKELALCNSGRVKELSTMSDWNKNRLAYQWLSEHTCCG